MNSVCMFTNESPTIVAPIVSPNSMVVTLATSFAADLTSRSTTPDSRIRLPNMRNPISGLACGAIIPVIRVAAIGNNRRARRLTGRSM